MKNITSLIKKSVRLCGFEVSRYSKTDNDTLPLFSQWVHTLKQTAPLEIVFDVGAHRGETAIRYRTKFPEATIYSFEPGYSAFSELKALAATDPNIKAFHLALGEHDGSATLHQNAFDATSSLLPNSPRISEFANPDRVAPKTTESVPIMRIDTFCSRESIDQIDLLKIDAQGYEGHILNGAGSLLTPDTIRSLFVEVSFVELYRNQIWFGELLELLRDRGYRLFGLTDIISDDLHGWKWADAMFIGSTG